MHTELAEALDKCLTRMRKGDTLEACLADYPGMSSELEMLISTAASIATAPKISPSENFRTVSKSRLLARLRESTGQARVARANGVTKRYNMLEIACRRLVQALTRPRGLVIPVTLLLLVAIVGSLTMIVGVGFPSTPSALAAQCTVSVLNGSPQIQIPGSDTWEEAVDGMVLDAGSWIRTPPDTHAVLTFFEGSSIKIEPGTDIQIERIERVGESSGHIVLKQWVGKTWSRVVRMVDADTHYEIQTPSANALVRGTLFEIQVDETGLTTVSTREGLVSVKAQNQEVFVPRGMEVSVKSGEAPSGPKPIPPAKNELRITAGTPAVASVCDPTGSSAGRLPNSYTFNQITGALSTLPSPDDQLIVIPNPVSGRYFIVLRGVTEGTSQLNLACLTGGEPVFTHISEHKVAGDSEWLISLDVEVIDGQLLSAAVTKIEPLGNRAPEKISGPRAITEATVPVKPKDKPEQTTDAVQNYRLVILSSDGGSVIEPGQGVFFYPAGTVVDLIAIPDAGCEFDSWTGNVSSTNLPLTTITMNKLEVVRVNFVCRH